MKIKGENIQEVMSLSHFSLKDSSLSISFPSIVFTVIPVGTEDNLFGRICFNDKYNSSSIRLLCLTFGKAFIGCNANDFLFCNKIK